MDTPAIVRRSAGLVNESLHPALRENAYQEALKCELSSTGCKFTEEATIPVKYDGFPIARMHPDLIVGEGDRYILELKVDRDGTAQLDSYLQYAELAGMDDVVGGLMISFGSELDIAEL